MPPVSALLPILSASLDRQALATHVLACSSKGLAPGAHGANCTGHVFTGDGSGDFIYPVLYDLGFANKPCAIPATDSSKVRQTWIASVVRCAPPGDKPTLAEIRACSQHLLAKLHALPHVRVVVTSRQDRLGRVSLASAADRSH